VDEVGLKSSDRRMARVLVEIDITAGLMDMLEVEWRGQVMLQRLDYQGILFRCTLCRRTGHLRRNCSVVDTDGDADDVQENPSQDAYMSEEDNVAQEGFFQGSEEALRKMTRVH
jgi:hypothetical protein